MGKNKMTIISAKLGRINTIKSRAYLNSKKLAALSMMMILWIADAIKIVQSNSTESGFDLFSCLTIFPQMRATFILTHFDMFAQMLLQEMKLSVMKTQTQLLEYIA